MKKVIKTRWLKALRSGKYKKTKECLRNSSGFCCLGVLTDLYINSKEGRANNARWEFNDDSQTYVFISNTTNWGEQLELPHEVVEWAETIYNNPPLGERTCAEVNDGEDTCKLTSLKPRSFKEIADKIEIHEPKWKAQ